MSEPDRRQALIARRRCVRCERKLKGSEQGALCSACYFAIICEPGRDEAPAQLEWRRAEPTLPR